MSASLIALLLAPMLARPLTATDSLPDCKAGYSPDTCGLTYYGGRVIPNVKVYQVTWGSVVDPDIAALIPGFFQSLTNSAYLDWLEEYSSGAQLIGRGTFAGTYPITPSVKGGTAQCVSPAFTNCCVPGTAAGQSCLDDSQVQVELIAQIGAGHLPQPDANTFYGIYLPPGVTVNHQGAGTCVSICAYHSTLSLSGHSVYYAVYADHGPTSGCGSACGGTPAAGEPPLDTFHRICRTSSHEMVESITDAEIGLATNIGAPLAWYDANHTPGNANDQDGEAADICDATTNGNIAGYEVEKVFSNTVFATDEMHACVETRTAASDFFVSLANAAASLPAGGSVVVPISTSTTHGAVQVLALSVTGSSLPAGVTAQLANASVNSGTGTSLTLTAALATAPVRDAVVQIVAASGVTHTAGLLLQVTAGAQTNDFSLSLSPATHVVEAGQSAMFTVSAALLSGTAETVTLTIAGSLPAGVTPTFDPQTIMPGEAGSTLTLQVDSDAVQNNPAFTFTVEGMATHATHDVSGQLTVTPPNVFSLSLSSSPQTVLPGGNAVYTLHSAVVTGRSEQMTLTLAPAPAGTTYGFVPQSAPVGNDVTLTLTVAAGAAPLQAADFTVTAATADDQETADGELSIASSDFSLSMAPPTAALYPGTSNLFTVSAGAVLGSASSVALAVMGLPAGVTPSFDNSTIDAGGRAMLTLQVASNAAPSSLSTLTVQGVDSEGLARSATAQVAVDPSSFTLAVSPQAATVALGSQTDLSVSTAALGEPLPIALSVTGLPAGVTGSFSPATVTAGQSAALTLVAAPSAALQSGAAFQVSGSANGIAQTVSCTLGVVALSVPSASVTVPVDGATVSGMNVEIDAVATAGSGSTLLKIELLVDGQIVGTATSSPAQTFWPSTQWVDGPHAITARAVDADGGSATSAAITVTVNNSGSGSGGSGNSGGGCGTSSAGAFALLGLLVSLSRRRRQWRKATCIPDR